MLSLNLKIHFPEASKATEPTSHYTLNSKIDQLTKSLHMRVDFQKHDAFASN